MAYRKAYRQTTPPPTGGWNTRDDLSEMPRRDAQSLINWIPGETDLEARKGYEVFVTLTSAASGQPVASLLPFYGDDGTEHLLSFAGGEVHRVDEGSADSLSYSGPGDATFYDGANWAGDKLLLVGSNGDKFEYRGSSLGGSLSGVSLSPNIDPVAVHVYKNRVYYVDKEDLAFYYTSVFQDQGAITRFPLDGIAPRGGYVVSIHSWTHDGGEGPEDYLAIFTSQGDVLVYSGSDPGSNFSIVGRYNIGPLVSNRTLTQVFGKLFGVTKRDYMFIPDVFMYQGNNRPSKLSGAARDAVNAYGDLPYWQAYYSQNEGLLIVNVPTSNNTSEQHVINVRTGAGTKFTGLNATCWQDFNDGLYFGTFDGKVCKYTGNKDNGSQISLEAKTAPYIFGSGGEKAVKVFRPRVYSNSDISVTTKLAYDMGRDEFEQSLTYDGRDSGTTVLPQDWPFDWPTSEGYQGGDPEWFKGAGRGMFVQLYLQAQSSNEVKWYGTDFAAEPAGIFP